MKALAACTRHSASVGRFPTVCSHLATDRWHRASYWGQPSERIRLDRRPGRDKVKVVQEKT